MNTKLRDEILAPYLSEGSTKEFSYFGGLPLNVLEKLVSLNCIELGEWNNCEGVEDLFLPFLKEHPKFTAHGYALPEDRPDCRITIEGVECDAPMTIQDIIDFSNTFFRGADDISLSPVYAYCWYD